MIASLSAVVVAGACLVQPATAPPRAGGPGSDWKLVWSDEFEGDRLDVAKWRAEDAAIMNNQELQYYTPDAVTVRDGVMTIRAERRPIKGRDYSGGLIDSRGLFSMAFGRLSAAPSFPRGRGCGRRSGCSPRRRPVAAGDRHHGEPGAGAPAHPHHAPLGGRRGRRTRRRRRTSTGPIIRRISMISASSGRRIGSTGSSTGS